ncbi:MAG TPA: CPBP family intramembrane metalloprotease domain-containing protein [Treponema sp.]|nr:CPBP family intramembrane metalloprotease domain-containing protein [Treponema sp.]
MEKYKYKPFRFYSFVFLFTWSFWIAAAFLGRTYPESPVVALLAIAGLFVPSVTALITILGSKSAALKHDFKDKLFGIFRLNPLNIIFSIVLFFVIIVISILVSTFFGQSLEQFAIVDFSFSIGGTSALLTIILAALLEELGWRGYAEDSIANYCSWWKESIIFGLVWALWHLPLIFVPGTYHYGIFHENPLFIVNFFAGVMPLGFLLTWVYVKNKRSILANMIFHFFINFMQEKIAMTQVTKCVQTFFLYIAAGIIVFLNKELFFEKNHIGNILKEKE